MLSCLELFIHDTIAQEKLPDIQAICRISLTDGSKIDGFISLGYSYDNEHYHPNAFYIQTANTKTIIPINLVFNGFFKENYNQKKQFSIYYAESKSNNPRFIYKLDGQVGQQTLNKKTLREEEYFLNKKLKIYSALPLSMKLKATKLPDENTISVNIESIKSFELVSRPTSQQLLLLKKAKEKLFSKMEKDKAEKNPWINFQEAIWYHEIIKDPKTLSKWGQYFE